MGFLADRTQERLALLVRAGEMFHRSLDVNETLDNVARMAVESFAELCLFDLIDTSSQRLYVTAGAHRNARHDATLKNHCSLLLYNSEHAPHPAVRVSHTGVSFFVPFIDDAAIERHAVSREHAAFMRRMGYRSKIVVPVTAQGGHIFGALTFVRTGETESFDESDVAAAEELGRRAGLAVANAKQYHREQHVASTLQRAFLSEDFPAQPGLEFHAIYRPGIGDAELGGDWYDTFETVDGWVIVTIGDVTGKGIEAARLMVQLRQSVRVAATLSRDPGAILNIVNTAMLGERSEALATAFVGAIKTGTSVLRYASAGHPPALLRRADGSIEKLSAEAPPLGIFGDVMFTTQAVDVGEGTLLVLYTDGVTEVTRDAIAGEEQLCSLVAHEATKHAANPARYIQRVVPRERQRDDIAIMSLRFASETGRERRFDIGDSSAAYAMKNDFMKLISSLATMTQERRYACELVVAELIGNAVRHAPGGLSLSIARDGDDLVLHLIDEGLGFDYHPELPADVWSESGRGLFLISQLVDDFRVERLPGNGSYIRITLPTNREPQPQADLAGIV